MKNLMSVIMVCIGIYSITGQTTCPVVNINTDVTDNPEIILDCNSDLDVDGCLTLTAEYSELPTTTNYEVQPIPYNPVVSYSSGQNIGNLQDDQWSDNISLPFSFCFYGNKYQDIVINDNGVISFNSSLVGEDAPYIIAGTNPNPNLPLNSIFGVFHDLTIDTNVLGCEDDPTTPENECGEITYQVIGQAPCRKVIVNYNNLTHFACSEQKSTTQIVLYEASNIIDVYIEEKPLSCDFATEKKSLLGIVDNTGSLGISPNGRNTGIWQAQGEAYRFQPIGESNANVSWYENNQLVGIGDTIKVCPTSSTEYTAVVEYGCSAVKVEDTIPVNFSSDYPIANELTLGFCYNETINQIDLNDYVNGITTNPNDFLIQYFGSENDAISNQNNISSIITLPTPQNGNVSESIYVRVSSNMGDCFSVAEIEINVTGLFQEIEPIRLCDSGNDDEEIIWDLQIYTPNNGNNYTFFLTEQDAILNEHSIEDLIVTGDVLIYYRVRENTNSSGCEEIKSLNVSLEEGINIVNDLALNYCGTFEEMYYDLTIYEEEIANGNSGLTFVYFEENENPFNSQNPIPDPTNYYSNDGSVYVQVLVIDENTGCTYISIIDISWPGGEAIPAPTISYCDTDINGFSLINVTELIINEFSDLLAGIENYSIIVFEDGAQGLTNLNNPYLLELENSECTKAIFFTVDHPDVQSCRYKINIQSVAPVEPLKTEFEVCDIETLGQEYINLTEIAAEVFPTIISGCDYNDEVTFYETQENAINETNPIEGNYLLNSNQRIFIKANRNGICEIIEEVSFVFNSAMDTIDEVFDTICDNNNDGKESYDLTDAETLLHTDGFQNRYIYFESYQDALQNINPISTPDNYEVSTNQNVFYLRTKVEFGCFNLIEFRVSFKAPIVVKEDEQAVCDDGDLQHTFNLYESLPRMTENHSQYEISFHKSFHGAENSNEIIQNPNQFTTYEELTDAYVRFYDSVTGCYSIEAIHLRIVPPPKLIVNTYAICDNDFDGIHDENLTNLNELIIEDMDNQFTYSYYESMADASNKINQIQNVEHYNVESPPKYIYVRVENKYNCFSITRVELIVGEVVPVQTMELEYDMCDDDYDGFVSFDLTQMIDGISQVDGTVNVTFYENLENLKQQINPIANPTSYTNTQKDEQTIYARVNSSGYCDNWFPVSLTVISLPIVSLSENAKVCQGVGKLIEPEVQGIGSFTYEWFDSNGNVLGIEKNIMLINRGEYIFSVTNSFGCTISNKINIEYFENPEIKDIIEGWNHLEIIADGHGYPIEYSMDGENWQSSNQYFNLESGIHSVYVRIAEDGCPRVIDQTILYKVENLVTPNNDGMNDTWRLGGLAYFDGKESTIRIFDRYGKVVHEESSNKEFKWDARVLGRVVPSASYIFKINLPDGRVLSGHIAIKNF